MASEKILVVEDDVALLDGLRDILELSGYEVITARNGVDGVTALAQTLPDLIVSDINMPGMDGYQFYAQVRARPEGVSLPFIFLTAKGKKADIRRGKMLGADDYLTKPFEEDDLLVAIRAKLNRRAELEAVRRREISDLKNTILTTLNHEFRTPLTYITTYTDILRASEHDPNSEEFKDFMRGVQHGSERLQQLVEDFMMLVDLQTGEARQAYTLHRGWVSDLPALLSQVAAHYAARAQARRVRLITDFAPDLPPVLGNSDYLTNAVGRLVDNAIKFSKKEGGQVTLAAKAGGGGVTLQVKDDGIGMPAAELDRIFDVFYQIDRAKMEQQGSGSGLAIAHGIVVLHGGTLTAASEPGVGSTFTIELPV